MLGWLWFAFKGICWIFVSYFAVFSFWGVILCLSTSISHPLSPIFRGRSYCIYFNYLRIMLPCFAMFYAKLEIKSFFCYRYFKNRNINKFFFRLFMLFFFNFYLFFFLPLAELQNWVSNNDNTTQRDVVLV